MHRQMEFICIPLAGDSLTTVCKCLRVESVFPYTALASNLGIIILTWSYDSGPGDGAVPGKGQVRPP